MKKSILSTRRFLAAAALGLASTLASHASLAVQIDVLVVYDDGVDDHYDGSPLTAIRNMVTTSNTYYRNSNVDIQLNLVGAENVNLPASLSGLASDSTVARLRDAAGADFVTLISNSFSACGQGYTSVRESRAFNIVKRSCMTRSFVHELGHNMGLGHSVAQGSRGSVHSYGVGWGEEGVFSTIMAYSSAYNVRSRTYKLSNPDVRTCNNLPCGRENVADSARALTNVFDTISNYRPSANGGGTDGGGTGGGNGDLLNEQFNNDVGGFSFVDDASDPSYSDGGRSTRGGVSSSGALQTVLGGVNNDDVSNMEASWRRNFTLQSGQFTLSVDANLVQTSEYEANESSDIGIIINGQRTVFNELSGNGNGGSDISTGFRNYRVSFNANAGEQNISLFCGNSEKTYNNEETRCTFDNIVVE